MPSPRRSPPTPRSASGGWSGPYRDFVQWGPADDLLDGIDIQLETGDRWSLGACLTTAGPDT